MECNKEEAVRAMEIAEKKMASRDFVSARKTAVRAQQLYPDLINISQMILVCDVHCAAQNKVYGGESDWYAILQIEPTSDEAAIKKQFRKLALSLHPDKNKFTGASDAFKMIGEAQKMLLDPQKRMLYDSKCKAAGRYQASNRATHQGSSQTNVRGHPWFQNKFTSNTTSLFVNQQQQQRQQQAQPEVVNNRPTFWTICPFCSVKYQYYRDVLNKTLHCQSCEKSFTGYEMNPPGGVPGSNSSHPGFPQQTGAMRKDNSTTAPQSTSKNSSPNKGQQGSVKIKNLNRDSFPEKRFNPAAVEQSMQNETHLQNDRLNKSRDSRGNSKKGNMSAESSESFDTESSTDSGEDGNIKEDGDSLLGENFRYHSDSLRRSTRGKQRVSYDENLSGDDEVNPSKRAKGNGSFHDGLEEVEGNSVKKEAGFAFDTVENEKEVKHEKISSSEEILQTGEEKETEQSSEPQVYEYPDPDFNDFDEYRKEECFASEQLWAVYDTLDAMPRFYALIRKVLSPGFRLKITWLEPDPDDEDKVKWVNEGLPASCGKFRFGHTEISEERPMFSHIHIVDLKKGRRRCTFEIYPQKGETWALFKGWDINWHSDPQRKKEYDYEFVEVLSEYDNSGVRVAYLGKVKGFACLFYRTVKDGIDSFLIPPKHIFRFSHKVPSFHMSGEEGKNVPQGSFELDPASLPANHDRLDVCQNLNVDAGLMHPNGSCSGSRNDIMEPKDNLKENVSPTQFTELKVESNENASKADLVDLKSDSDENEASVDKVELKMGLDGNSFLGQVNIMDSQNYNCNGSESFAKEIEDSSTPASEAYEIPEPEFYNFDADKSMEKFQVGQIWAVYGDEDALPKYYGMIKKIDSPPRSALHLTWLLACPPSRNVMCWTDKKMPICCGNFKLGKGKPQMFTSTGPFSHKLRVPSPNEKNVYAIFPEKGDIWALYKNWSSEMTCSDLENCEYDLVEILGKNEKGVTVLFLELVTGHKSVFKPQNGGQSTVTRQILWNEVLRFSHQIPACRLTEEKDGSLRSFWELDPAALPIYFFCSS
ncbi:hypothetical protein ACH5RR_031180 [Cinchona calisaya]|uniref:J domain-containing protein n=1 Tax=Cinchona calisaya TaxID=153742 RepID=A0ABD2YEG0_9GENT